MNRPAAGARIGSPRVFAGDPVLIDPSLRVSVANILAVLDAASSALDLAGPGNRLPELPGDQGRWGRRFRLPTLVCESLRNAVTKSM